MNLYTFDGRFRRSCIARCAGLFGALVWGGLAFGGEIHSAAMAGDLENVKALVNAGPDLVFSKDNQGLTPLHWAAQNGPTEMVEFLLRNMADVNAKDNNGRTPLDIATRDGRKDMVKWIQAWMAEMKKMPY